MFTKFFAFILLIIIVYVLGVFVAPGITDTYGNPSLNTWIRQLKTEADTLPSKDPKTLYESLRWTVQTATETASGYIWSGRQIIEETKKTIDTTKQIIDEKVEQAHKAKESVEKAYDAVNQAKNDIQNLTTNSGVKR